MKKRDWIIIAATIFVIQTFFNIRPLFIHPQHPYEIPEYYKVHEEKEQSWPEKVVGDPVSLFTLMLTLFTGGLYLATRSLWTSTEKLVFSAEKTAIMQLRAYILVSECELVRSPIPNQYKVTVKIMNYGQTPGIGVIFRCRGCACGRPEDRAVIPPDLLDEPFQEDSEFVSGPGMRSAKVIFVHYRPGQNDLPLGSASIYATTVFIQGVVDYTDSFGALQTTDFCLHLISDGVTQSMVPWYAGNRAT